MVPWNPEPADAWEDFREAQAGQTNEEQFAALDEDIELSSRRGRSKKLSAMVEWEFCPAIVQGIVELPSIEERVVSAPSKAGGSLIR